MKRPITNKKPTTVVKSNIKTIIDAAIAEGLKDIAAGRVSGPFKTVAEFHAHLHKRVVQK